MLDRLEEYFRLHQKEMLRDIRYLVEKDSPSMDKQQTDACKKRIQDLFLRYFGYMAEEIKEETYGNHLRFTMGKGKETLLILSHFDTVWNKGDLTFKIEGNKVYGPGILDMKAGLVQAIWALKAVKDLKLKLTKKVVFLCTSDEEIGSPSSRRLIEKEAKKSKVVLVTEPPVAGTGALKTGRKGTARYFIEIKGKSAHAGNDHEDGINAIEEAAHVILYLQSLTDYYKGTTINVGQVKGGGKLNVVPDTASIGVNVRARTLAEQHRIDTIIKNLVPVQKGIRMKIRGGITRPPMNRNRESQKLFRTAKKVASEIEINLKEAYVGGSSDANFTANLGIPTLDGLGAVGSGIHAKDEHILLNETPRRTTLLCKLIIHL